MNASSAAWRALRVRAPQHVAEDLGLRRKILCDVDTTLNVEFRTGLRVSEAALGAFETVVSEDLASF